MRVVKVKFKRTILSVVLMPLACTAFAGFEIEGTPALTTETGLLSNRTHYEQDGKASFRMPDAKMIPAQKKYEDAKAKLVVDKVYRVVTHKGTGKAIKVFGYADSVPLDSALAMVIPAGWQVYQDADLKNETLPQAVSFEGGKEWPDVLHALGGYNALRFHIDWYDKVVMMGPGRPAYTSNVSRIRIIDEPVNGVRNRILGNGANKPKAVAVGQSGQAGKSQTQNAVASAAPALVTPVKPSNPIDIGSKNAGATTVGAKSAVSKSANAKPVGETALLSCSQCLIDRDELKKVQSSSLVKAPIKTEPVKPVGFSLFVREGFLQENIVRLSKENGWNAPDWQIGSDFKIASSFSVSGKSFPETIAKLLMIHPIEADVNTNQRKIYVTKEIQ